MPTIKMGRIADGSNDRDCSITVGRVLNSSLIKENRFLALSSE